MEYNLIGDIHGNIKTLEALLKKMPASGKLFAVGDMVDRGPNSKAVIELVMSQGMAVLGNHEHFMIDALAHPHEGDKGFYQFGVWGMNGGDATCYSYVHHGKVYGQSYEALLIETLEDIPLPHLDWLRSLPSYFYEGELFVSHAPKNPSVPLDVAVDVGADYRSHHLETSLLWNRGNPRAMHNAFQVYGHMAYRDVLHHDGDRVWGMCIDTYRGKKLTGLHWPSMEIFQQEIID